MRERRSSSREQQSKAMNVNGTDGVRMENYMKSPTRRTPMRSSTPVRNGHLKRDKQQTADNRKTLPRSSSLISRRKKVSEISENEKPADPEYWLKPDTYDLLNTDIVQIKRSLVCLSRLLVQENEEREGDIDKESNGHKTDSEEKALRDLKEKVSRLQRETEEKNRLIERLRNEINTAKQNHVTYATKATQTDDYLDELNNNFISNGHEDKLLLSRTVSDTTPHKTSSKFSKVPLPWRRSQSGSRKKSSSISQ